MSTEALSIIRIVLLSSTALLSAGIAIEFYNRRFWPLALFMAAIAIRDAVFMVLNAVLLLPEVEAPYELQYRIAASVLVLFAQIIVIIFLRRATWTKDS